LSSIVCQYMFLRSGIETTFFWAASISAILVTSFAWYRRTRLLQHHILLIYLLLTFSLSLAVVSLTDLTNFSLLGDGADAQTGRLLAGLFSFGLISLFAARLSGSYPLACAWWFTIAAVYTILPGSDFRDIAEQYQAIVTGIRIVAAGAAFLFISHYKQNLNNYQYLSVLVALVASITFLIPPTSDNLPATLLATVLTILVCVLFRFERRDASVEAVLGLTMLLLLGFSSSLTSMLERILGNDHPATAVAGSLLFFIPSVRLWQRRYQLPRGLLWVSLFSFLFLAYTALVTDSNSEHLFVGLLSALLLFITALYLYSGNSSPQLLIGWRQFFSSTYAVCAFLLVLFIGCGVYSLSVIALEDNLGPARILALLKNTPVWPGDKRFIEIVLKDEGLWPEQVGTADDSKECLGDHIRKIRPAADRYSAVISVSEEQNYQAGITTSARGYRWMLDGKRCLLMQVDKNSPAGAAQLKRGDQVLAIDGVAVNSFKNRQSFNRYWDRIHQNPSVALKLQNPAGRVRSVAVPLGRVEQDPPISTVVSSPAGPVGYLYLDSFNDASFQNIRSLFSHFRQAHVRDLVLDLRYNSGGDANKAELLSSLIAGQIHDGKLLIRAETSARYPDRATSYTLKRQPESLSVSRLVVLTTDETCSASEVIINGLRPYLPVYTVGSTTCGKPYLMHPIRFGGDILYPVNARLFNSKGDGAYTSGIKPDQKASDDFTHELGDLQEEMFKRALQLLAAKPSPPALFK